jgi:hypothetical protein
LAYHFAHERRKVANVDMVGGNAGEVEGTRILGLVGLRIHRDSQKGKKCGEQTDLHAASLKERAVVHHEEEGRKGVL